MTVVNLTQCFCDKSMAGQKRYDLRDAKIHGLFMRVEASGRKTWYINYRTPAPERRLRNVKLAPGEVALAAARDAARNFLARLYLDKIDPANDGRSEDNVVTLRDLIELYEPWAISRYKSGRTTIRTLKLFHEFMDDPVSSLTTRAIERWQTESASHIKGASINRRVAALSSMLKWAQKQDVIGDIPFKVSKVSQKDSRVVTRYLTPEERRRLMDALDDRERQSGADYLKTAVVVSLNTGIRKGTLLSLLWEDIDFHAQSITLRAAIMKGGRDATLPLNSEAFGALLEWQGRTGRASGYIFPGDGSRIYDTRCAFKNLMQAAAIENFTWHCMRHDFASQLAMKGVPLHVIQRLMCHSTIEMTQRYAHLSPNSLESAVRLLEK